MNAFALLPKTSRRQLLASALLAAGVMGLPGGAAWAQGGAKGGAANLAMIGEPQSLDPMISATDLVGTIMQHVYEPLYTFDAQWNIKPLLAEGMPAISSDGLTYTITLRKGVKFHNGKEMTADDVVYTIQRATKKPSSASIFASFDAENTKAVDELTVDVATKAPFAAPYKGSNPGCRCQTNGQSARTGQMSRW